MAVLNSKSMCFSFSQKSSLLAQLLHFCVKIISEAVWMEWPTGSAAFLKTYSLKASLLK